jgi:hypothetical protein
MTFPDSISYLNHFGKSLGVAVDRAIRDLVAELYPTQAKSLECHVQHLGQMLRRSRRRLDKIRNSADGTATMQVINSVVSAFQAVLDETLGIIDGTFAKMSPLAGWIEFGRDCLRDLLEQLRRIVALHIPLTRKV